MTDWLTLILAGTGIVTWGFLAFLAGEALIRWRRR